MITENEQYGYDYTWFMADKAGFISSFSTGASILPKFVSNNCDSSFLISQTDFFLGLKEKDKNNYVLNPELRNILKLVYSFTLEYYLEEPIQFVNRGLYSYDKDATGIFSDTGYHLVAKPVNAINIDDIILPVNLRELLENNIYNGYFEELKAIDIIDLVM